MATGKHGDKFRLLIYERRIARHRWSALLLAVLLLGLWYLVQSNTLPWPPRAYANWLLLGGLAALIYWLFTLLAPGQAYVQARENHFRLQTPFLRLNIPYTQIHNTRPIQVNKIFAAPARSRAALWLLKPFLGSTALGIDLHLWPRKPEALRLFLSPFILAPDQTGFILLVKDWMALSNQLHARMDTARSSQIDRPRTPGISAADILREG